MRTLSNFLIPSVFLVSLVLPGISTAGDNCTCRFAGGEIVEGQTACIKSPKGMTMARCEKVLNNTSWKMLDVPCPTSAIEPVSQSDRQIAALISPALSAQEKPGQ